MLKKHVISNDIVTVLKACGKRALAAILGLDRLTSLLRLLHIHVNLCDTVPLLAGFVQSNERKLEEAEDFKCVFVIFCVLESK